MKRLGGPYTRKGFRDTTDHSVPGRGKEKAARISLGLDLLARRLRFGQTLTHQEIAAWAGCSDGYIVMLEQSALRKLRKSKLMELLKDL